MIVQTSIADDELAPAEDYKVRANLTAAAWVLKPVDGGVKLTYIVSISLAGASMAGSGLTRSGGIPATVSCAVDTCAKRRR